MNAVPPSPPTPYQRWQAFSAAALRWFHAYANWLVGISWKRFIVYALALVMFVLPLLLPSEIGALVGMLVWGAATFAIVPPAQMRVMHAAAGAPGLASSVNVGAFNLGNALGAVIGGGVISAGLGYAALPVAGGLLAAGGLLLVMAATARRRVAALDPA